MVRLIASTLIIFASQVTAATVDKEAPAKHHVRGLGGRATEYECKYAMEQGWLTTNGNLGIENKGANDANSVTVGGSSVTLPFQDFPCGNFNPNGAPFNGSGNPLKCTYFKEIDQYECECTAGNCREIIDAVTDTAGGTGFPGGITSQPCTANGYALTSRIKTYWWQCGKV